MAGANRSTKGVCRGRPDGGHLACAGGVHLGALASRPKGSTRTQDTSRFATSQSVPYAYGVLVVEETVPPLTAATLERIERDGDALQIDQINTYLQDHLGERVTVYLAGLTEARTAVTSAPTAFAVSDARNQRLRGGYKAVRTIVEAYDATTARAWLFGTNSQLDDQAPVDVIGRTPESANIETVVRAAQGFVAHG